VHLQGNKKRGAFQKTRKAKGKGLGLIAKLKEKTENQGKRGDHGERKKGRKKIQEGKRRGFMAQKP